MSATTQAIQTSLGNLKDAIAKDPGAANITLSVGTVSDNESLATKYQIRQFEGIMDEPPALAGTDLGPNPVEFVLAALGNCQEIVYRAYAAALGIQLDRVEVRVRGDLDLRGLLAIAPVSPGLLKVAYTTTIESPESEERLQELVKLVEAHCPVLDTLQRPIEVSGKVKIKAPAREPVFA
jgi:uncharacterized OsmC-like protein